jgi:hypothetical protein
MSFPFFLIYLTTNSLTSHLTRYIIPHDRALDYPYDTYLPPLNLNLNFNFNFYLDFDFEETDKVGPSRVPHDVIGSS